ncbi:ArfGap-domain-containing protein [Nemania abortiva]|nr:ArfGap-domain-containing protein [Nemania abortiva]
MGVVSSRLEDGASVYLKDQNRLSISSLTITCPRKRTSTIITPNAFPATRASVTRTPTDTGLVEYIQDPEPSAPQQFLLRFSNDDELIFNFTFIVRQEEGGVDTHINGLTWIYASTSRDLETLVTREFHADPNLHKNANVELVNGGNYNTGGSSSITFEWQWKWKPPRPVEDRGGGWRNVCSFLEYDARAHRLHTLATFSFWVANTSSVGGVPFPPSPFQLAVPPKIRVPSAQSADSRISEQDEPGSPPNFPYDLQTVPTASQTRRESVKLDIACPRPGEDMTVGDDGPVFRATIKALEQKTGNMRAYMKKVLKKAEQAHTAQTEANEAYVGFMDALREASTNNANAVQPAIEHYFDKIAREILAYEKQNTANLQKNIIEPISKLYTYDIKQAESKKRDFEEESKDYYAYVSRYLGQRQDSVKTKKLAESDNKYQTKRKNFELKRFDYSSFVQDLHGGRKEQEVLSHLTKYADTQARSFMSTSERIDGMMPHLKALTSEVQDADKEYQYQRREREEKRRVLEKSNLQYNEPDNAISGPNVSVSSNINGFQHTSDSELGRADSTGSQLKPSTTSNSTSITAAAAVELSRSPGSLAHPPLNSPVQTSKFKGIRDLEERDLSQLAIAEKNSTHRKEGLLWALNRPGTHVDPLSYKQGWHKFWVVLDQGKLSEYSNWKQKLDLHMEPIDLRMASVREARTAERRFCFEVITPQYKRVYQATSGEDMNSWIFSINNALQSAMEGHGLKEKPASSSDTSSLKRDIGSILTGKSSSLNHGSYGSHMSGSSAPPSRRTTVGARPVATRPVSSSYDDSPDKLLQSIRESDQGNCWCADCGSSSKVEWVSINLGIILCIECSGIHRSLGTHISKVRSLTLDITSFTLDIIEVLLLVGNRVSNMVWEARLDSSLKPGPQATREQRLRFITAKYVERAYVEPISTTLSRYATADETLLAAIKRNEIQQVIHALALRANPNVLDKVRDTHPIFLALAAADPASPSPGVSPTMRPEPESRTTPFAIAEMLIQNGAEIPATMPAFPLSRNARMYIDEKRGRTAAIEASGLSVPATLGPNPNERIQREKDARLQKRISAGGRLAKSPIPER